MSTLFYVSFAALWLLLLVEGVMLILILRHFGHIALGTMEGAQRDGLPVGERAPTVKGVTPEGLVATFAPQLGQPHLLLFASLNCVPCETVLPVVNQLAAVNGRHVEITAIVPGQPRDAADLVEKFALRFTCFAEAGSGAADRYRVRVTPFGFVIGSDGRILAKGCVAMLCGCATCSWPED
jgi:thiol-disulfide isomerase/thioredoxin